MKKAEDIGGHGNIRRPSSRRHQMMKAAEVQHPQQKKMKRTTVANRLQVVEEVTLL